MHAKIPEFNSMDALNIMFAMEIKPIAKDDPAWFGLEGQGYITELDDQDDIVIDITDDEIAIQVYDYRQEEDGGLVFNWVHPAASPIYKFAKAMLQKRGF